MILCVQNLKSVALPVPDIIGDWSFGWGLWTSNLGKGPVVEGREWHRWKDRWWFPIGPHSNFYSIFTRFRDCSFCSQERHFFPSPPLVSPKISPFPRGNRWIAFWLQRAKSVIWNSLYNWFPRFPTYVITIHQRHRRRTDDMRSQDRALHQSALRGKSVHRFIYCMTSYCSLQGIPQKVLTSRSTSANCVVLRRT